VKLFESGQDDCAHKHAHIYRHTNTHGHPHARTHACTHARPDSPHPCDLGVGLEPARELKGVVADALDPQRERLQALGCVWMWITVLKPKGGRNHW
jgi:hypothetical protein